MENWLPEMNSGQAFWLCLCVGLWIGAKPNVPIVGWLNLLTSLLFSMVYVIASQFNFFCAVAKKLKHEAVGCRVCKKSACWSVSSPVFLMSNGQVCGCRFGFYACW